MLAFCISQVDDCWHEIYEYMLYSPCFVVNVTVVMTRLSVMISVMRRVRMRSLAWEGQCDRGCSSSAPQSVPGPG